MSSKTRMLSIDFNFFNIQTGIFMDAKMVFVENDQGTFYIEVDTNRFTTSLGFDRSNQIALVWLGFLANFANMVITCRKIKSERMQKRMLVAYLAQEAADKDEDKKKNDDNAEEEDDYDEDQFDLTDGEYQEVMNAEGGGGKWFRRCKFGAKYTIRFKCLRMASVKNHLTIYFNILMMVNAIVKESTITGLSEFFLNNDMHSDYVDFAYYLKQADAIMLFDMALLMLIIIVLSTVIFDWLPGTFNRFLYFVERYANRSVYNIYAISLSMLIMLSFLRTILDGQYLYNVSDFRYALVRNLLVLNGGYFLESGIKVTGSIEESNTEIDSYTSVN